MPPREQPVSDRQRSTDRYRLSVRRDPGSERLSILGATRTVMEWRGEAARRLISAMAGSDWDAGPSPRLLSKADVREIALEAAAAAFHRRRPEQPLCPATEFASGIRLGRRLEELGVDLRHSEAIVAELLFRYPGVHLREDVAIDLLQLERPLLDDDQVRTALERLVETKVCQRVRVEGLSFYDIDITPHLHVYCPETRELHDAPRDGILKLSQ